MAKKYCWYCDKNLDTSLYHKSKNRHDGLQGMCKKCHKLYRSKWLDKNKIQYKEKCKEWSIKNKKHVSETKKIWRNNNREYFREHQRKYKALKRKNDPIFRITANLRIRLRKAIKGINKSKKTMELLGCSIEEFKEHIEKKFKKGMTWNNYGKWELDHIKPCCGFDLNDLDQQKKCFNYANIQPLWKKEHRQKTTEDTKNYLYDF
jgi:hypothetical protein